MTYLVNHKQNSKREGKFTNYLAVMLLVFILVIYLSGVFRSTFVNIFSPFFRFSSFLYNDLSLAPDWFKTKSSLLGEVESLQSDNDSLRARVSDYAALVYENNSLRKEFGMRQVEGGKFATVISRPPQIAFDTLLVDKGKSDGVMVGDIVVLSDRTVVGDVVEVSGRFSRVKLFSISGSRLIGYVSRTGAEIELEGFGGGNFHSSVPIDFDIAPGDLIINKLDRSYSVAVVGFVEEQTPSGLRSVLLSIPVPVVRMDYVYIVPNILKSE